MTYLNFLTGNFGDISKLFRYFVVYTFCSFVFAVIGVSMRTNGFGDIVAIAIAISSATVIFVILSHRFVFRSAESTSAGYQIWSQLSNQIVLSAENRPRILETLARDISASNAMTAIRTFDKRHSLFIQYRDMPLSAFKNRATGGAIAFRGGQGDSEITEILYFVDAVIDDLEGRKAAPDSSFSSVVDDFLGQENIHEQLVSIGQDLGINRRTARKLATTMIKVLSDK